MVNGREILAGPTKKVSAKPFDKPLPHRGYLFVEIDGQHDVLPRQVATQLAKGNPIRGNKSVHLFVLQTGSPDGAYFSLKETNSLVAF